MLSEEVNEQAIEIMIVVVVRLREDTESGAKFANKFQRPNLIHRDIVHRRAQSEQHGQRNNDNARGWVD